MYVMYGNMGLEAHLDVNHTIGASLLTKSLNDEQRFKKWILFDFKYTSDVFGEFCKLLYLYNY